MVEKEHLPWAVRCLDGVRVTAVALVELAGTEPARCDPSTPAQDAPLLLVLVLLLRELFLDQHVLGSGGQAHNLAVSFNATLRCVALACRQTDFFSTRLL